MQFLDLFGGVAEFLFFGPVDDVLIFLADHVAVGGDDDHVELVGLLELGRFGFGRTGHAGQLFVHAEVVLEGDGGERLVLALDLDAFLGFDGLVQTVAPAAARHHAAGELVDDDHLAVLHQIILVAMEEHVGLQRLLHVVERGPVFRLIEIAAAQQLFHFRDAFFGERGAAMLLVDRVIAGGVVLARLLALDLFAAHQLGNDAVDLVILVGGFFAGPGDDQRGAGFVDQDGVHFVDDGEVDGRAATQSSMRNFMLSRR